MVIVLAIYDDKEDVNMACFDNTDYHFSDAYDLYLEKAKCKDKDNEENIRNAQRYASTHIGIYMEWIIKHNLEGDLHKQSSKESLKKVRNNEMNGTEFFLKECGGKLYDDDFNEEGLNFTESYYDDYLSEYGYFATNVSKMYLVEYTKDNYEILSKRIDIAYKNFKKVNRRSIFSRIFKR